MAHVDDQDLERATPLSDDAALSKKGTRQDSKGDGEAEGSSSLPEWPSKCAFSVKGYVIDPWAILKVCGCVSARRRQCQDRQSQRQGFKPGGGTKTKQAGHVMSGSVFVLPSQYLCWDIWSPTDIIRLIWDTWMFGLLI